MMQSGKQKMNVKKIDVTVSDDSFHNLCCGAYEVLTHVRDWPRNDIEFEPCKDGITNHLLKCYLRGDPDNAVLVRVYGKNTEIFIERDVEMDNMQIMHEAGQCEPLYCAFQNGLCYGFSPGVVLDEEMVRDPSIFRLVACQMAKMHSIKNDAHHALSSPSLFSVLLKNVQHIPEMFEKPLWNQSKTPSKESLFSEVNILKSHLTALGSPVVFCHNDLLLKNIIYNKAKGDLSFIDYEYANCNYQAYDIGNHFCEFCGVDTFEPNLYPDEMFQLLWLEIYLEEWYSINGWKRENITKDKIYQLYIQVNKFALAAHLFWGVWALIQAANSTIDFDYFGYAAKRLDEYFARKDVFLSLGSQNS